MIGRVLQKHKDILNQRKQTEKSFNVLVVSLSFLDCHTRINVRCSLLWHINQNMTHISEYHLGVLSITSTICVNTSISAEIQLPYWSEISAQTHVFHLCMLWIFLQIVVLLLLFWLICHSNTSFLISYSGFLASAQSQILIPTLKYFCSEWPYARIHKTSIHSTLYQKEKLHQTSLLNPNDSWSICACVMSCHKMSLHRTKGHLIWFLN